MTFLNSRLTLRSILRLDGVACLGMGAGIAALAPMLGTFTDLAPGFLRGAGVALLPVGAFILAVASRREIPARSVASIVVGNAAWVLASVALPLLGLVQPNAVGLILLLGQAAAVAGLTGLEQALRPGRQGHITAALGSSPPEGKVRRRNEQLAPLACRPPVLNRQAVKGSRLE